MCILFSLLVVATNLAIQGQTGSFRTWDPRRPVYDELSYSVHPPPPPTRCHPNHGEEINQSGASLYASGNTGDPACRRVESQSR